MRRLVLRALRCEKTGVVRELVSSLARCSLLRIALPVEDAHLAGTGLRAAPGAADISENEVRHSGDQEPMDTDRLIESLRNGQESLIEEIGGGVHKSLRNRRELYSSEWRRAGSIQAISSYTKSSAGQ